MSGQHALRLWPADCLPPLNNSRTQQGFNNSPFSIHFAGAGRSLLGPLYDAGRFCATRSRSYISKSEYSFPARLSIFSLLLRLHPLYHPIFILPDMGDAVKVVTLVQSLLHGWKSQDFDFDVSFIKHYSLSFNFVACAFVQNFEDRFSFWKNTYISFKLDEAATTWNTFFPFSNLYFYCVCSRYAISSVISSTNWCWHRWGGPQSKAQRRVHFNYLVNFLYRRSGLSYFFIDWP